MPTVLGPKYSLEWRGKPPHMLKVDIPIWYRFLEENKDKFTALYYDCRLGGPGFTPADYDEKLRGMWKYLGSKRADAIAYTEDEVWIIEVTNESSVKAIGQLMMYKSLWLDDPKSTLPVKMVLVCDFEDAMVFASARSCNIQIFLERGGANNNKQPQA
jgi:hypothetical protein